MIFFRTLAGSEPVRGMRTASILLCSYREHLVALYRFIKKTRVTPDEGLATARKRQKELER